MVRSQTALARQSRCPPANIGHQRFSLSPISGPPFLSTPVALSHWLGVACARCNPTQMHQWLSEHSSGAQALRKSGGSVHSVGCSNVHDSNFSLEFSKSSQKVCMGAQGGPVVDRNGKIMAGQRWSGWLHLNMPPACCKRWKGLQLVLPYTLSFCKFHSI